MLVVPEFNIIYCVYLPKFNSDKCFLKDIQID